MPLVPLAGRRIVVCRSEQQSLVLTSELADAGAEVVHLALLPIVAPADGGVALRVAMARIEEFDWIVFTSANAVDPVIAAATDWPPPVRIAAVGSATAAALVGRAASVDHLPERATAASLASSLPLSVGRAVLAPLAELAGSDLTVGLRARGFDVTQVEAYRLGPPPTVDAATIRAVGDADAVLFTSPSTVDRFAEQCGSVWPSIVISIGPSTTARISAHGRDATAEADPAGLVGLIAALVNTLTP